MWRSVSDSSAIWEKIGFDTDRFSVITTVPWGLTATSWCRQTHLCEEGKLRVKEAQERLSFSHEESHWDEYGSAGSSATTIMVPLWQRGQRLRSTPVISRSKSLAD